MSESLNKLLTNFTQQIWKRHNLSEWIRELVKKITSKIPQKDLEEIKRGGEKYCIITHPTKDEDLILKLTWKKELIITIIKPLDTELDDGTV